MWLIEIQWNPCQTLNLQNCNVISVHHFKPLSCSNFYNRNIKLIQVFIITQLIINREYKTATIFNAPNKKAIKYIKQKYLDNTEIQKHHRKMFWYIYLRQRSMVAWDSSNTVTFFFKSRDSEGKGLASVRK